MADPNSSNGHLTQVFPRRGLEHSATVDIVAVHGLGTSSPQTWIAHMPASEQNSPYEVNWLCDEDMLPAKVPTARIWTFHYNVNCYTETPVVDILGMGNVLLQVLQTRREEEDSITRPLMFIASCFGGLLVTQALESAGTEASPFKQLLLSTIGVIFLGTPFRGSSSARVVNWRLIIAGIMGEETPEVLVNDLERNTGLLESLMQRFSAMAIQPWLQLPITCFYETGETQILSAVLPQRATSFSKYTKVLLVDRGSACIDGHEALSLDAPHSMMNKFKGPKDPGFKIVSSTVRHMVAKSGELLKLRKSGHRSTSVSSYCTIPFERDQYFIGREAILDRLWKQLQDPNRHNRSVIYGLGGIGKSQIAIEHAYRCRENDPQCSVFWVHCGSTPQFERDYRKIAAIANLPRAMDPKANVLKLVSVWLSDLRNGSWLMVLDNADDLKIICKQRNSTSDTVHSQAEAALIDSIPRVEHGTLLITTRYRDVAYSLVADNNRAIHVEIMSDEESLQLLQKDIYATSPVADARALVNELEHIPLAISQANAYIRQGGPSMTISKYLSVFQGDTCQLQLLEKDNPDMGRNSGAMHAITRTWEISFQKIQKEHRKAASLSSLMCYFYRKDIPKYLLTSDEDPLTFHDRMGPLLGFSLVKMEKDFNTYEIHRLVQIATRKWLKRDQQNLIWERNAIQKVLESLPIGDYKNWIIREELKSHTNEVLQYKVEDKDVKLFQAQINHNNAWYLVKMGKNQSAQYAISRALETRRKLLGTDSQETLATERLLVSAYKNQRLWKKAEELEVQAMEKSKRVLGVEHPSTLVSMSSLVSTYMNQGRWKEAEELVVPLIEMRKRVLGVEHPTTLISTSNLASTYTNQGRWKEAEELEIPLLETRKRVLGAEHSETLSSIGNLAMTYASQGRWNAAEELAVPLMETSKRVLGAEHPDTLIRISNLAMVYMNQERWKEAEELEIPLLETKKKVLGLKNPNTLISMSNLAFALDERGQKTEAIELMKECVELRTQVFGADHPQTLSSYTDLIRWKSKMLMEADASAAKVSGIKK